MNTPATTLPTLVAAIVLGACAPATPAAVTPAAAAEPSRAAATAQSTVAGVAPSTRSDLTAAAGGFKADIQLMADTSKASVDQTLAKHVATLTKRGASQKLEEEVRAILVVARSRFGELQHEIETFSGYDDQVRRLSQVARQLAELDRAA